MSESEREKGRVKRDWVEVNRMNFIVFNDLWLRFFLPVCAHFSLAEPVNFIAFNSEIVNKSFGFNHKNYEFQR